jgi:hypothetical protein
VSADIDIDEWLNLQGLGAERRRLGRLALETAGLTRPGKTRLSVEKVARAHQALSSRFALHCHAAACIAWANASGKVPLATETKQTCQRCGGSENARAAQALTEAGIRKLVVVGGTPATREEIERLLDGRVELRLVDGTRHRPIDRAKADLEWADRVLLWGATELHHKVSKQYADAPTAKSRVVHIPRRGVAQLLSGAVQSMLRAGR